MREYSFEFDQSWSEIDEPGWNHSRMLRDSPIFHSTGPQAVVESENMSIIVPSGTLRFTPAQSLPDLWYDSGTDDARLGLDNFNHAEGFWEQHPITYAPGGNHYRLRSLVTKKSDMTLLELLGEAVIKTLEDATISPVLVSTVQYPANQGFKIEFDLFSEMGMPKLNYMAIRFGDFVLVIHRGRHLELYWSANGSLDEDSWVLRKRMWMGFSGPRPGMGIGGERHFFMTAPAAQTPAAVTIEPFGRGNILFVLEVGGVRNDFVYSHPEAHWDDDDLRYHITAPGTLGIYTSLADAKNLSLSCSTLRYATSASFIDELIELPYAPTIQPRYTVNWVRTLGEPQVTTLLLDEDGSPFLANGVNKKLRLRIEMTGDGKCTPWVDSYHIIFDPVPKTYPGDPFTVDDGIQRVAFSQGVNWDDDRCTVVVRGKRDDPDIARLAQRAEINAMFNVDGNPISRWLFKNPKVVHKRTYSEVTLEGTGYGGARLAERRFFWPPSFGGFTHPQAVESILSLCGFLPEEILTFDDTAKLPETTKQGEDGDHGESDFRCQPKMGSAVTEYLRYIIDTYSPYPRWTLRYIAREGRWRYGPHELLQTEKTTFYSHNTRREDDKYWYSQINTELEGPEANIVYLIGKDEFNQYIGNYAVDVDSIECDSADRPLNYVGRRKPLVYIDTSINTQEILDYCLRNLFEITREAILWVDWTGPWAPELEPGDNVRLEGLGLVQMLTVSVDVDNARRLEVTPAARYTGRVVMLDNAGGGEGEQ